VAVVLVQLERQDGHPRSGQGGTFYAQPIPDANRRVRATRSRLLVDELAAHAMPGRQIADRR